MNKVKANEVLKAIPTNNVTLLDKEVQFWVNEAQLKAWFTPAAVKKVKKLAGV